MLKAIAACFASVAVVLSNARILTADVRMDDATKQATTRALEWLARKQNPNGSWSTSRFPQNTAVTAFALLAFMSQGHLPNQGTYGPEVAKGARFLLAAARPDGYLVGAHGGNMYCHAMATLALAELWGMTGDDEIKPVLKKAVDLIIRCQNHEGGWRYEPAPTGADISVTIMQVMALRAAKNSGLFPTSISGTATTTPPTLCTRLAARTGRSGTTRSRRNSWPTRLPMAPGRAGTTKTSAPPTRRPSP